ncbi:hypothetical protein D9758_009694 [Tetrapyrgos nigripes]|uniref:Uncharacterized protein n=1 Tax=Tetrapyrgos nigripes TaxID=182062 RepID=A0A8H5CNJ7_9AGAR|nr:hypothetical protein D9758_009694 [Tetrapyrgos nigripes]
MLKGNGIECWISGSFISSLNPTEELPHEDVTTRVEDGVTIVETTLNLARGLDWYELDWRKAEDADPQSLWCVVKWTSGTAKQNDVVLSETWMSHSDMKKQERSAKDSLRKERVRWPRLRVLRTTKKMGTLCLEVQRIKGDKDSGSENTKGEDIPPEDKKPFCVFIFKFINLAGSLGAGVGVINTVGKGKKRSRVSFKEGSDDEHLQPSISPKRKRPRLRIKPPRLPPPPPLNHDSDEEHDTEAETDESHHWHDDTDGERPVPMTINSSLQIETQESQIIEPSATASAALAVAASHAHSQSDATASCVTPVNFVHVPPVNTNSPPFLLPLVPARAPGSARSSCTNDGALMPISADLGARIHELREAEQELVKEKEQQMELENELAEITKILEVQLRTLPSDGSISVIHPFGASSGGSGNSNEVRSPYISFVIKQSSQNPNLTSEIPHQNVKTRMEEGVTIVETTLNLARGLSWYELIWRKAEDADPQSLWCVVKWTSATARQNEVVWSLQTTKKMGSVRLELQRIKGDVTIKNSLNDITVVEDVLLQDEKPTCVFIFEFVKVATEIGSSGAGLQVINTVGKGKKQSRVSFEEGSDDEHLQPASISPKRKLKTKPPRPPPPPSDHNSDEEDEHETETETSDESHHWHDGNGDPGSDDASAMDMKEFAPSPRLSRSSSPLLETQTMYSISPPKPSSKSSIPNRGKDFVWKQPCIPTVTNPNSVRPAAQPGPSSSSPSLSKPQVQPSSSLKSKLASRKRDLKMYRALLSSSASSSSSSSSSPGNPLARRGSKNSKSHALPETSHSPTTGSSLDGPVRLAAARSGLRTPPKPQEGSATDDSTTTVPLPLCSDAMADARPVPEAINSSLQIETQEFQIIEPSATGSAALAVAASPFLWPLVPVPVHAYGSARTSCTIDGVLMPISADLGARIHELEEANHELVKEKEQQMELENELAEITKARTQSLNTQIDSLRAENERKRKWLQLVRS